jgi:nucleotidyltransferase substrate binding protein (TIGR01987 family)
MDSLGTGQPRWLQRHDNLGRAVVLLREAVERPPAELSPLEREGTIQRFEYTFELAWKTLKDFLEARGYALPVVAPKDVIKQGYAVGILADGQVWIDMLGARNAMSHTYDESGAEQTVAAIRDRYIGPIETLHRWLASQRGGP